MEYCKLPYSPTPRIIAAGTRTLDDIPPVVKITNKEILQAEKILQ